MRLIVQPGSPKAWEIQLKPGPNFLGRNPANDFQIEDPSVSGSHCEIVLTDSAIYLRDLGSTNGTFVNQAPISQAALSPGQSIRLGNVEMLLAERPTGGLTTPAPVAEWEENARMAPMAPSPLDSRSSVAPAESDTAIFCKNHYQNPGRYFCQKCRKHFCDLCVNTRGSSSGGTKFCKVCGQECAPVSVQAHMPKVIDFFREVPRAFKYPFVGDGLILLLGGGLFFGFLDGANYIARHAFVYGMRAMTARAVVFTFILGTGYLFSFLKKVIYASAEGDRQMPDWPDLSEWNADIVSPMFQFVVLGTVSFGPALALQIWSDGDYPWLVGLVSLLGCVYFPMAFLGVAMFDSLTALNPAFVFGSIQKVPREYALTAVVFIAMLLFRWLGEKGLALLMPIPLAPALIADLLALGLLIVEARILGLLYLSQRTRLNWFKRFKEKEEEIAP